ncbi:MAG: sugar phosphate nucleotidyltransferase [Candidatus Promineifilaceae bacterium]|nr:sugar phosphate nucleotidyltransferase [Candidatus Promineifilaceae bacterium]
MSGLVSIVPAAGLGSRLGSIPCSKEIMPLGFRTEKRLQHGGQWEPITAIETHLLGHQAAGVERCCIVIGPSKHDIVEYLGNGSRLGLSLTYLYQQRLRGMPFALDLARPWIDQATVLFSMPDTLITPTDAFSRLAKQHRSGRADVTLGLFNTETPEKFGMIQLDAEGQPVDFIDKPKKTDLQLMWGMAIWSPTFTTFMSEYLEQLPEGGPECVLSDVFLAALREGGLALDACVFSDGRYHDIGTPESFQAAVFELALLQANTPDLG